MSRKLIFLFITFFISSVSWAIKVPSSITNGRNGLYRQTLGAACFSFDLSSDAVPCNPAYLAKERDPEFKIQLFGGNNISYLPEATEISKGEATPETIRDLFKDSSISEMQGAVSAYYVREKFSISYEPYAVRLQSTIRNSALPELTLFGVLDDSISTQFASYITQDLYLGLTLRYLRRQSVASRFFATDIAIEKGMDTLNPEDKSYLLLEPGLLYSPEGFAWRPEASLTLVNGGIHSTSDSTATDPVPEVHFSVAVSPEVGLGRWGLSLGTQWSSAETDDRLEMLTIGSYYEIFFIFY